MSSSIIFRTYPTVAGSPVAFSTPFPTPALDLATDPAIYEVPITAAGTVTLWDGAPLSTTYDVLMLLCDQTLDVEFSVNSGASLFTLVVKAGGFPTVLWGSDAYVGGLSGSLGAVTSIRAKNRNTTTAGTISVLLGKAA